MGVDNCIDCDEKKAAIDCNCIPVENADGTLQDIVLGCTDPTACNYDALANCDDGSCEEKNPGCMNPEGLNYSTCYNADCAGNCVGSAAYIAAGTYGDTSCCCNTAGCTDAAADNYAPAACIDDGSCEYTGCMDPLACNYDTGANVACSGCCTYPPTASVSATACDSYTWALDGQTYYTSGAYTHSDGAACPTTTTLNLTINNATSGINNQNSCTSYTWSGPLGDGTTYNTTGTYTNTSTNAAGCTHTETLNLTMDPSGCTTPGSLNYDAGAICDDGSCISPVGGCTYGPDGSLPGWGTIAPGGTDTYAIIYGISDPGIEATNYAAGANVEDGSCIFCVYGCTDPLACNYNPAATCEADAGNPGTGICTFAPPLTLDSTAYGQESPNPLWPNATGAQDCCAMSNHMCVWEMEAGEPVFGAHCTDNGSNLLKLNEWGTGSGTQNDDKVYSETWYFELGNGVDGTPTPGVNEPLVPGQTYCITWSEIVLALRHSSQCSDCLMGGWWIKIDDTLTGAKPSWGDINDAMSLYDPVANTVAYGTSPGPLNQVSASFHNAECATNDVGNSNGVNSAGASNGSHSEWVNRCITFNATQTTHRIHVIAVTDFELCTSCNYGNYGAHGTYVGMTKLRIDTGCSGCSCS